MLVIASNYISFMQELHTKTTNNISEDISNQSLNFALSLSDEES